MSTAIAGQLDALALIEPDGIHTTSDLPAPTIGRPDEPVALPPFCEVVELAQPYRYDVGDRTMTVRWGFACNAPACAGKDMSHSGVGWIASQAIRAAQLHAQLAHGIH